MRNVGWIVAAYLAVAACGGPGEPDPESVAPAPVAESPAVAHTEAAVPDDPIFALSCVRRVNARGGWDASVDAPTLPGLELGDLKIGAPASAVKDFKAIESGCENQDGDCVFLSPSGLTYALESDRVVNVGATREETAGSVALPLGLQWGMSREAALSHLCREHANQWIIRNGGDVVVGILNYTYGSPTIRFTAGLFFETGELNGLSLQEIADYGAYLEPEASDAH